MLKEKEDVLQRYKITAEYLEDRIIEKDKVEERQKDLINCQTNIDELEKIINFLKV